MEGAVPFGVVATLIWLVLAKAINSEAVLAGNEGCTATMTGMRLMLATAALSRMKSKLRPLNNVALTAFAPLATNSECPSAGGRKAAWAARLLAAPGRLSTKNC